MEPPAHTRVGLLLALLWLAFVVRGFWYCAVAPPWEGFDEPFHFSVLQNVANGHGMPHAGTPITLEVQNSLHLLPIPWMLQFHAIPPPLTTYDDFWKLPAEERDRRLASVRALDSKQGSLPAIEPIINYESQQMPLYYWLFALPLHWMSGLPLLTRLYFLRMLSVLGASLSVPLAYWIARCVLQSVAQALSIVALIVLLPELMINLARVSNESLAMLCYSAMLAAAMAAIDRPLSWRAWLLLGLSLGCGLLAKAYLLSAVPAVMAVALLGVWKLRQPERFWSGAASIGARLLAALLLAGVIAGSWYSKVHASTGSWSGEQGDVAASHLSWLQKLAEVPHVNWKSGVLSIVVSHVWFGGWSFLKLANGAYRISFVIVAAAVAGVLMRLWKQAGSVDERQKVVVLVMFYVSFWAGLLYHVFVNYLKIGVSASTGWYLYATVAVEAVLLIWGLQAFASARVISPALAVILAALDLYAVQAYLMPYYSGFSAHVGDSVPASLRAGLSQLPAMFERLAILHPAWLSAPVLWCLWTAYVITTVGTVVIAVRLVRWKASRG